MRVAQTRAQDPIAPPEQTRAATGDDDEGTQLHPGQEVGMRDTHAQAHAQEPPVTPGSPPPQAQALMPGDEGSKLRYFEDLVGRSRRLPYAFPTKANLLDQVVQGSTQRKLQVCDDALGTRPVIHQRVATLVVEFLDVKRRTGTEVEQRLYTGLSVEGFLGRLVQRRPLVFMGGHDQYMLTNQDDGADPEGFDRIGTAEEREPLCLHSLLSYHEMQLSALVAVSVPTYFINQGSRGNGAAPAKAGTFEDHGVYVAQVGARFERHGRMEAELMVITPEQNTRRNGFGDPANTTSSDAPRLQMWARFYGKAGGYLRTFAEVEEFIQRNPEQTSFSPIALHGSGGYVRGFLDVDIYRQRMHIAAQVFLFEAQARAAALGVRAFCHVVGLGLGVWQVSAIQAGIVVDVYRDVMENTNLANVSDVAFSWFPRGLTCGERRDGDILENRHGNQIKIHFNKRNPAEKLHGEDADKLLVAQYAWDGNSYPGNEYWIGCLSASGDPAAACCSTIPQLQNPDVNCIAMRGANFHVARLQDPEDEPLVERRY